MDLQDAVNGAPMLAADVVYAQDAFRLFLLGKIGARPSCGRCPPLAALGAAARR